MVTPHLTPASLGSRSLKKGRHRRFEEARKLKQSGPDFLFAGSSAGPDTDSATDVEEDEYTALARKYGALDEPEEPAEDG